MVAFENLSLKANFKDIVNGASNREILKP
jgi:hypothetical protein